MRWFAVTTATHTSRYPGSPDFRVHQVGGAGGFSVINITGSAPVRQRR
jgi:hypothetical protein